MQNLIKELRESNDYNEAYIKALRAINHDIAPLQFNRAINLIKDYQLSGCDDYVNAGEYLKTAIEDFKSFLACEGLFLAIAMQVKKDAQSFLNAQGAEVDLNKLDFQTDGANLWIQNQHEQADKIEKVLIKEDILNDKQYLNGLKAFNYLLELLNKPPRFLFM